MLAGLAAVVGAAALGASRAIQIHRIEREIAGLRPVGTDGLIPGAEGFYLHGGSRAVLLLHGFGDTPQALRGLADSLVPVGWTVSAPLLPGHGRTVREFARSRRDDWIEGARAAYLQLRSTHESVALVGLSMGGAIATILAAEYSEAPAVVLLAPYLGMPRYLRWLSSAYPLWGVLTPYVRSYSDLSIQDAAARAVSLGYGLTTPHLLHELACLAEKARRAAPRVTMPTLMVQSREDHRIPPAMAEEAFRALGALQKELIWLSGCGHVITVDYHRDFVAARVEEWLGRHAAERVG